MRYLLTLSMVIFGALQAEEPTANKAECSQGTNLIIIRHGEAEHNVKDVYNSNPNHPAYEESHLTEKGKQQVNATAKKLVAAGYNDQNVVAVFVSPLPRTVETADLLVKAGLFSESKIQKNEKIIELQVGDLENKPVIRPWQDSYADVFHSETDVQVKTRAKEFYKSLVDKHLCGNIIVVTHKHIAEDIVEDLKGNPEEELKLDNAEYVVFPLPKAQETVPATPVPKAQEAVPATAPKTEAVPGTPLPKAQEAVPATK